MITATAAVLVVLVAAQDDPMLECAQKARSAEDLSRCSGGQAAVDRSRRLTACQEAARTADDMHRCTDEAVNGTREEQRERRERAEATRRQRESQQAAAEEAHRAEARAAEQRLEEQRRAAEADAAAHRKRVDEVRSNPKVMHYLWSSLACFWEDWRRSSKEMAEKEKRYGREFGAVRLDKLYRQREQAELADTRAKAAREELRTMKAKAVPCRDEVVVGVVSCIWYGTSECEGEYLPLMLELAYELDPDLNKAR